MNVHNGNLRINGYIQTSNGVKLDYHYLEENKKKKKKFTDEQIEVIRELHQTHDKLTQKQACLYLEKNHSIKLSVATYSKIINSSY